MRHLLTVCVLLLALSWARADIDPSLREDGVLYFEDSSQNRIFGDVKKPTTIYMARNFASALALLVPGQKLELIGMAPEGYIVKGVYRNNAVTGWIAPGDLPADIDPKILDDARKLQAHQAEMADTIKQHKVIRGMTPDDVRKSVGEPEQTASRTDEAGTAQTWTYTQYTSVWKTSYQPGFYGGQGIATTYLAKVPIGQMIVTFTNGIVSAVDENKTDPNSPSVQNN